MEFMLGFSARLYGILDKAHSYIEFANFWAELNEIPFDYVIEAYEESEVDESVSLLSSIGYNVESLDAVDDLASLGTVSVRSYNPWFWWKFKQLADKKRGA